ncbi:sugar phosphate isomerase/epimerase family protein [Aquibacillus albus]|uniref:Sugar phosphate isomerase/epimerase n=1 Tax=Aquibacillus albus TaxID=1168171 RepID=A0ABS2MW80_9BACI|nr:sugar phosphate isomerase/epimerase family protein [Aquibacillus albus]MBM7570157.1 sugar phosphate isomerase/epimerase [Aquibacillus albus]
MKLGLGSYIFRYAVGTNTFQPEKPMDAVKLVEKAADMGAELVQFADNLPLDNYDEASLKKVTEVAEQRGITLEAGTAGATEARLLRHLKIAKILGAKLVRIAPHAPDVQPSWDEMLHVIQQVLPQYKEANITIGIENHFMMKSEDLVALVQSIDDSLVGICVDTGNSIAQEEWPYQTVQMLAPYAVSLHLKDYKLDMHPDGIGVNVRGTALGDGRQDIQNTLNTIQKAAGDVNIVLEQWMPTAKTPLETLQQEEEWIKKGIKHIRSLVRNQVGS